MKKKVGIITLLVLIDQLIKIIVIERLNEPIILINNFLQLNYVKNFGVAWSLLNNKISFITIASAILILYATTLYKEFKDKPVMTILLSVFIAGALGNFIDRLVRGFVVDYIDVTIFGYDFPVFNLADILLVCSAILMTLLLTIKVKNEN